MDTQNLSRRNFLKNMGAIGGSGLLLSSLPQLHLLAQEREKQVKGQKARLAIIGTGSRGMYHINHLLQIPHAEVVALCDIYQPHLDNAAKVFPKAKQYKDYNQAIADPNVDGILIATPLHMHAPISIAGLKAGKHVFCEKSMARTVE
ncbi:Gfo/Idh/MocA family protein, partial [Parabacteroides bouchesdurhonensis]